MALFLSQYNTCSSFVDVAHLNSVAVAFRSSLSVACTAASSFEIAASLGLLHVCLRFVCVYINLHFWMCMSTWMDLSMCTCVCSRICVIARRRLHISYKTRWLAPQANGEKRKAQLSWSHDLATSMPFIDWHQHSTFDFSKQHFVRLAYYANSFVAA